MNSEGGNFVDMTKKEIIIGLFSKQTNFFVDSVRDNSPPAFSKPPIDA